MHGLREKSPSANSHRLPSRRSVGGLTPSARGLARSGRPPRDSVPAYACRLPAGRTSVATSSRGDGGSPSPFTDDHLEIHRVALGNAPDLDHVDLLGQSRCNFEMEGTLQSLLPRRNLAGDRTRQKSKLPTSATAIAD